MSISSSVHSWLRARPRPAPPNSVDLTVDPPPKDAVVLRGDGEEMVVIEPPCFDCGRFRFGGGRIAARSRGAAASRSDNAVSRISEAVASFLHTLTLLLYVVAVVAAFIVPAEIVKQVGGSATLGVIVGAVFAALVCPLILGLRAHSRRKSGPVPPGPA